jgi:hypothetical protein
MEAHILVFEPFLEMSAEPDMEHNDQGHSNEMTPPLNLTRNPRFSTMSSTSLLLGEEIISALSTPENSSEDDRTLSNGTLSKKDHSSSSGGLSDILECGEDALHSSQSEESSSKGDNGRPSFAPSSETAPAANLPQPTARTGHHQAIAEHGGIQFHVSYYGNVFWRRRSC